MVVRPYWINANLAIVPRPRGDEWLDDEMKALRNASISVLVSMLEPPEAQELGLACEGAAAEHAGLEFLNFPIQDRTVPSDIEPFTDLLEGLERRLAGGKHVGVHCRGCIGRASVVAASLLIRSGVAPADAWRRIEVARGLPVPDTLEQREWVDRHMDTLP